MGAGMTLRMMPVVLALTRAWLRVYTSRLPRHLADARRAEIESDIWEMQHDSDLASGRLNAALAIRRVIDGMPDDIAWRFDNAAIDEQLIVRRVFALSAASVLVLSLWTVPTLFVKGDRDVAACAAAAPRPQTRADFLDEVVRCAGAFFATPR
jgi:hypothetical protein